METVKLQYVDSTKVFIDCPQDIQLELSAAYSFEIPGKKYHPLVKARRWDGIIRLYNRYQSTMPLGLVPDVSKLIIERGYNLQVSKKVMNCFNDELLSRESFTDFVKTIPICDDYHEKVDWRDYQLRMIYLAAKNKRHTFLSATSTGKSASIYGMTRYFQHNVKGKILIIVPNVQLVEQLYGDFRNYSYTDEEWVVEDNVERLYAKYNLQNSTQILISTWQSLLPIAKSKEENPREFFNEFGAVIVDECHTASGDSISTILNLCGNTEYRIGLTGTLTGTEINEMTIKGHLGPVVSIQTAKQAMESGHIAQARIECIKLKYPVETLQATKKLDYSAEIGFICGYSRRNNFLLNLVKSLKGNTLVLFARVEQHGDILNELFSKELPDNHVHYIHGGVEGEERDSIRAIVEQEDNAVIIASYGTTSTGTNIKRIHNIIFASPSKSVVRVLQSLGRGLRKAKDKDEVILFDIIDDFGRGSKNTTLDHSTTRFKIYEEQGFSYKLRNVNI